MASAGALSLLGLSGHWNQFGLAPETVRSLEVVDDFATWLQHRTLSADEGIAAALRELISSVTITPAEKGPTIVDITGRMAVLTGANLFPTSRGDSIGSGGALQL